MGIVTEGLPQTERLLRIMRRLRDPAQGCPWDRAQDFRSIAPHTIEEAYEVAESIECGDLASLRAELGDLLFQVVFHAQLGEEQGAFDFEAVAGTIADKLERRHPHVFGESVVADAGVQGVEWERHKAEERDRAGLQGTLAGIPLGLPAMTRAVKLGKRAARVGFDWPDLEGVLDKVAEERAELLAAIESQVAADIESEFGDLLFAMANLARHLGVDPETALRGTNRRFERRFAEVEAGAHRDGVTLDALPLESLEIRWQAAKRATD